MNSITRPRRRCRVKSVNFKVFGWLLVREAAIRVWGPYHFGRSEAVARKNLSSLTTSYIRKLAAAAIRQRADRRYFP